MGNRAWRVGHFGDAAQEMAVRLRRPAHRALHALPRVLVAHRVLGALVEHHLDVAAVGQLHVHDGFRREGVAVAVQVGIEHHAVFVDLAQSAQAEHLKAARIGEDRIGPGHELVQSAHLPDGLVSGTQVKMIGIGEQDRHAEIFGQVALRESLDRGLRAHGHEYGRFDGPVRRMQ